ncbi:MAG: hypothetical protein AABX70_00150 [Nanoarchaeota archaeon]
MTQNVEVSVESFIRLLGVSLPAAIGLYRDRPADYPRGGNVLQALQTLQEAISVTQRAFNADHPKSTSLEEAKTNLPNERKGNPLLLTKMIIRRETGTTYLQWAPMTDEEALAKLTGQLAA